MKTTLLIMAAGIGSRFGTGIKQLEPVDDANHIIMDYSIHDAIEAIFLSSRITVVSSVHLQLSQTPQLRSLPGLN